MASTVLLSSDDASRHQYLIAATFGILSHLLYFIRGYHDTSALGIFLAHAVSYTILSLQLTSQHGIWAGLVTATAISLSYLTSLFSSIAIYRLFFHPLRRFPGPLAAKISKFYGPYTAWKGKMHIEQTKLFDQYGDIVRIAPNELLILSTSAIDKIHASKSGCRKRNAGIYNVIHYKGTPNLDTILDREEHRWRRQVWERAMTTKALNTYEVSTREVCHTWLRKIESFKGAAINTSLFSLLITFDNMGKVGYSHDFSTIEAGKENRMLDLLEVMFGKVGQLGELVWPIAFMQAAGITPDADELDDLTERIANERQENRHAKGQDIFQHFLADFESEKPVAFFNRDVLYADAGAILVGATDTIAAALSYSFFHLAAHQDYQTKLHDEVAPLFGKTLPGEFTNRDLSTVEFLDAVINETMRLDNPTCNSAARLTPPEGIEIDDIWIPGGTAVRVPQHAMQRSPKAFVHPDEFIPERWTTRPELVLDRAAFFPFLSGPNNCVGKRLAMSVTRLVLSYTVFHYQLKFAPGEDGTAIYRDAKNNLILKAGPLNVSFTKRE